MDIPTLHTSTSAVSELGELNPSVQIVVLEASPETPIVYGADTWVVDELGCPCLVAHGPVTEPTPAASEVKNGDFTREPVIIAAEDGASSVSMSPYAALSSLPCANIPCAVHGFGFRPCKLPTSPLAPNPAKRIPFLTRFRGRKPSPYKETVNRAATKVYEISGLVFCLCSLVYIVASDHFL